MHARAHTSTACDPLWLARARTAIHGYFIDDFWCSDIVNGSGACTDPVQGPTEIDPHSQADMGLSDEDVADITRGWLLTMTAAQQMIVAAGAYTWSLVPGQVSARHCCLQLASGGITECVVGCRIMRTLRQSW